MKIPKTLIRIIAALGLVITMGLMHAQASQAAYSWTKPIWVRHYITQYFHPPRHKGVDIGVVSGSYTHAITAGRVIFAGWDRWGFGYMVMVRNWNGTYALYAHNRRVLVRYGQWVSTGQGITLTDSTGYSTGPHLHLQMYSGAIRITNPEGYLPNSTLLNPYTYLLARGVRI